MRTRGAKRLARVVDALRTQSAVEMKQAADEAKQQRRSKPVTKSKQTFSGYWAPPPIDEPVFPCAPYSEQVAGHHAIPEPPTEAEELERKRLERVARNPKPRATRKATQKAVKAAPARARSYLKASHDERFGGPIPVKVVDPEK